MSVGIHIKAGGFDRELIAPMIASKPDLIVVVGSGGDLDILRQFRAALGDTCAYGFRAMAYEPWIESVMGSANPEETAAGWLDDISIMVSPGEVDQDKRMATLARDWGWVTWQGLNEQSGYPKWQAAWDAARVALAVKYKIKVGICAWGWGQPEPETWADYDPALRAAYVAGPDRAVVILHDYWGSTEPDPTDKYIFMRWLVYSEYCAAHGMQALVDKQTEFWEYGKDQPGWRYPGGPLPAHYIDQLFTGDSFSPWIRKAAYDCSILPDDPGDQHWYSLQENYIIRPDKPHEPGEFVRPINLLLPRISAGIKTLPRQSAPPVDPPTDPVTVALVNPGMEEPALIGPAPVLPLGWEFGYNPNQAEVHSEIEMHPTHVKTGRQSTRMWGVGPWQGWYYQTFDTVPGATYAAQVDTLGTVTDTVDAPSAGKVKQKLALDPTGGTNPAGPIYQVLLNADQWYTLTSPSVKATGPRMTVFYKAENENARRADVFLDNVRITMLPATNPNPLDVIPLPAPIRVTVTGADGYLRIRSAPVALDPPTNETGRLPNGHRFDVDARTYDGKWYRDLSGGFVWAALVRIS